MSKACTHISLHPTTIAFKMMPTILGQPVNEIYHTGAIREELSRSIIGELPKKPRTNDVTFIGQ